MLNEGTMLNGRYEILGKIGAGGMADVYKGKDHKLNRFIAIKVLKKDFMRMIHLFRNLQVKRRRQAVLCIQM